MPVGATHRPAWAAVPWQRHGGRWGAGGGSALSPGKEARAEGRDTPGPSPLREEARGSPSPEPAKVCTLCSRCQAQTPCSRGGSPAELRLSPFYRLTSGHPHACIFMAYYISSVRGIQNEIIYIFMF